MVRKNAVASREATQHRLSRAQTPEEQAVRKKVSSRKYRPTSASGALARPRVFACASHRRTSALALVSSDSACFHCALRRYASLKSAVSAAIGVNLDRAALLNPQSYGKPIQGWPTSYECKHAHRPVLISDGAPGFYRKTAGPSPVMWGGVKGDGRLAQMDSRTF